MALRMYESRSGLPQREAVNHQSATARPPILYYRLKRGIPRPVQIILRRALSVTQRWLHAGTWPIDPSAGARPDGIPMWPEGKRFAFVLRHDVETRLGLDNALQLAELESKHGLRSAFYIVPEEYGDTAAVRSALVAEGFEVGIHGLTHDGMLYSSHQEFSRCVGPINSYLHAWGAAGFASPSAHHQFDWLHELDLEYDTSSFDTDPFEPQPDGVRTIFPMLLRENLDEHSYVELPYTLPQDFTLFVILQEHDISVWKRKVDWIVERGGLALLTSHPDYMVFPGTRQRSFSYNVNLYERFLDYVQERYSGEYWHALPRDIARYWRTVHSGPPPLTGSST